MFTAASAQALFLSLTSDVSYLLGAFLGILLAVLAALLGLGFGIQRMLLWVYNNGGPFRDMGTPPWRGYNRWRSKKWNMEHTM